MKPIGIKQWKKGKYYVYGIIDPIRGDSFFYEFSHLDSYCFQEFLNILSQTYPEDLNIIQLDNASFHREKGLKIPQNICLIFQPAHAPEVNPIERVWEHIKGFLSWQIFANLNELRVEVRKILEKLTNKVISNLTAWQHILYALSFVEFYM